MLKRFARDGNPTTFLTLTVNPSIGQDVVERARELSDALKIMIKRARRKFTKGPIEYLAVFEETKKGEPHLHLLMRAPFLPQRWLSDTMDELIKSPIVDIRKVGSKRGAARYIAKYVAKGPRAFGNLKRYWSTPGFNREARDKAREKNEFGSGWRIWQEPIFVIAETLHAIGHQFLWITDHEILVGARSPPEQNPFYSTKQRQDDANKNNQ